MAKSGVNTKRYSLVFATAVAFCTVCAAGVSTFAWFQANASATVTTSSSSATITVTKPDDVDLAFYVYNGNNYRDTVNASTIGSGANPAYGYKYTSVPNSVSWSDFTAIGTSSPSNSASNLTPGKRLTFCIRVGGEDSSTISGSHSGYIGTVSASNTRKRYLYSGGTTSTLVLLSWAINVYGTCFSTSTNPSASDVKTFLQAANPGGGNVYNDSSSGENHSSAFATGTASSSYLYFLYTIEFSNASTTWYRHVDSSGATVVLSPTSDSESTYWVADDVNGTSEVYEGLSFGISQITIV